MVFGHSSKDGPQTAFQVKDLVAHHLATVEANVNVSRTKRVVAFPPQARTLKKNVIGLAMRREIGNRWLVGL